MSKRTIKRRIDLCNVQVCGGGNEDLLFVDYSNGHRRETRVSLNNWTLRMIDNRVQELMTKKLNAACHEYNGWQDRVR